MQDLYGSARRGVGVGSACPHSWPLADEKAAHNGVRLMRLHDTVLNGLGLIDSVHHLGGHQCGGFWPWPSCCYSPAALGKLAASLIFCTLPPTESGAV